MKRNISKTLLVISIGVTLILGSMTGCLSELIQQLTETDWTWPAIPSDNTKKTTESVSSSGRTETTRSTETVSTSTAGRQLIDFHNETTTFDQLIRQTLIAGLDRFERSIDLNAVVTTYLIRESQIDDAIDRIFDIYTQLYLASPRYFYLNGSFELAYSVEQGDKDRLSSLFVEPTFWSSTDRLTAEALQAMIADVNRIVENQAGQIRQQSSDPVEQLILAHDWLIQTITYNTTGDQGTNHAGSALLNQVTLCQGYAQAFQLIGQELGLDVRIITGTSNAVGHAWNLVVLDGIAYHVDVTHDDPVPDAGPGEPNRHIHLFRSDQQMRLTNQWDEDAYPACPVDGAFYYRNRGLVTSTAVDLEAKIDRFLSTITWPIEHTEQLEVLLDHPVTLDPSSAEQAVQNALKRWNSGKTVYYRVDVQKGVAIVQISGQAS